MQLDLAQRAAPVKADIDLLVLDVHGVVLNSPLRAFLRELAERTSQPVDIVLERWYRELRRPAWTGQIEDEELWRRLLVDGAGRADTEWHALLESRYELGPVAPYLERWNERVPIWLLSNHRSHWLLPRLERFGLSSAFERVLVSDELRAAKPSRGAFEAVLRAVRAPERVLFVDDQEHNVRRARELGLQAFQLTSNPETLLALDRRLRGSPAHESV